jgi:hypothetical protein
MRETDIRSSMQKEIHGILVRVGFVVECKHSTDKLWLLFSGPWGIGAPAKVAQRAASSLGGQLLVALTHDERVQRLPVFSIHDRPAYGMTQAFTTGCDVTYSAISAVAKAATADAEAYDSIPQVRSKLCEIVLPLIVVDGLLFETFLDDDGRIEIEPIKSGTLLWRNPLGGKVHTMIRVMVKNEVEQFVDDAAASIRDFFRLCEAPLATLRDPT